MSKLGIGFLRAWRFVGCGFADARKKQVVSKYHRVVAKEKRNLGDWNAKLKKIYSEAGSTVDEDPLERFATRKKKKKRKNTVTVSSYKQASNEASVVTAVEHSDEYPSQSCEAKTASNMPPATPDNSR